MLVSEKRASRIFFFFSAGLIFVRSAVIEPLIEEGNYNKAYEKD